jgi:excisionase family DNA binding protein
MQDVPQTLTTHEVARQAGIHRDTLLRWLREGHIPEPARDRRGWRLFTVEEVSAVVHYATSTSRLAANHCLAGQLADRRPIYEVSGPSILAAQDWDFSGASTGYLTHSLHPYPAKFIPQIPNTIIQELSSVGETVLDPFCGSGTTLVEALVLRRHAIGVDANPLACLIAEAKTSRLEEAGADRLRRLSDRAAELSTQGPHSTGPAHSTLESSVARSATVLFPGVEFWFDAHVIDELATLRSLCVEIENPTARKVALTVFSSIIVGVSLQDSDTRYVRRDKGIKPGESMRRFARALSQAVERCLEFGELTDPKYGANVVNANVLDEPQVGPVDLVVCSPPYPNAYSYHLYHRTRMLWLGMDQPTFKRVEIGSHRKYSSKSSNAATSETFRAEMKRTLGWPSRYACFVLGDSTLKGSIVHNDELLIEAARATGFTLEANIPRRLQDSKKSFNPSIGKIKTESIVVLRNAS